MPFVRRHRALGCIRDLPWQRSSRRERLRARVDSPPRRDEPPSRRLSRSTFAVCWPQARNWTLEPRIFRLGHVHWDPPARPRQCQHAGGATVGCQALHSPCTTLPRPREMDSSTRTRPGGPGSSSSRLPVSLRSHYYMMAQNQSGGRQRHRQDEAYDLQKVTQPDPPPPLSRAHRELRICRAARLPSAFASMRTTARPTIASETASTMMMSSHATSALIRSEHGNHLRLKRQRRGLQVPDGAWQRAADGIVPQQEADAAAHRLARWQVRTAPLSPP